MTKKTAYLVFSLFAVGAFILGACGGGGGGSQPTQAPASGSNRPNPPAEYASKTNPKAGDAAAASSGKTIFQQNCASCHGEAGKGDGPAAASLNPKPADIADNQKSLSDAYLFWRISEGGQMAPFNSQMPSWKNSLSEDQIWQVIDFIRTLQ